MASVHNGSKIGGVNFISPEVDLVGDALKKIVLVGVGAGVVTVIIMLGMGGYLATLQATARGLEKEIQEQVGQLEGRRDFEAQFIMVQEKLDLYSEINADEKMADLFPKLTALIPDGVRVQDLIISKDKVEIICFVPDQTVMVQFYSNLEYANAITFDDGQRLTVANVEFKDIIQNTSGRPVDSPTSGSAGYNTSLNFNYAIN